MRRVLVGVLCCAALATVGAITPSNPATAQDDDSGAETAPPACSAAELLVELDQVADAIAAYREALKTPTTEQCAIDGLVALATAHSAAPCAAADALLEAGQSEEGTTAYRAVVAADPDEPCAAKGIIEATYQQVATLCSQAQSLIEAGEWDTASTKLQEALALDDEAKCATSALKAATESQAAFLCAAGDQLHRNRDLDAAREKYQEAVGVHPTSTCAANGLEAVADDKATYTSARIDEVVDAVVSVARTLLVLLAAAVGAVLLTRFVWLWTVRWGWWSSKWLVPKVQLATFTGFEGKSDLNEGIPALVRSRLRTDQQGVAPVATVIGEPDDTSSLITAIKDIDARLAAWASMARQLRRLWARPTLVIAGHLHEAGDLGPGISVSITEGTRQPATVQLWGSPDSTTGVTETAAQDFYDLAPGVATWILHEAARLSGHPNQQDVDSASAAHLAIGYQLELAGRTSDAARHYRRALELDPDNIDAAVGSTISDPLGTAEEWAVQLLVQVQSVVAIGTPVVAASDLDNPLLGI
ncbi:MAG: tetratricopeptide repeat protein [bacterium]|nr:tetratricopeptide repeat protein [bacterium]